MSVKNRGFASMELWRRREVGRKGGTKTAAKHDMAALGKKGGKVTARRGSGYYATIGAKGGSGKRGRA